MDNRIMMNRRNILSALGASAATFALPNMAFANSGGSKKFIFILQRGAADGLMALAPTGDPAFEDMRGSFVRDLEASHKVDSYFTMHGALNNMERLYAKKQLVLAHAISSSYRDRSHFDGQNVLETGGAAPYVLNTGWLNRLIGLLPDGRRKAIGLGQTLPLALRGEYAAASFTPNATLDPHADLLSQVSDLYSDNPLLSSAWEQALQTRDMVGDVGKIGRRDFAAIGELMSRLIKGPEGANIATYETTGWDTHTGQSFRSKTELGRLDSFIAALQTGLGDDWDNTVVVVATEFGRTVRMNGTQGTDHGTGSLAYILGGAVRGGRVISDWPGIGSSNLLDGRDLMPTTSLEMMLAGVIGDHFKLDSEKVSRELFPGSIDGTPVTGITV